MLQRKLSVLTISVVIVAPIALIMMTLAAVNVSLTINSSGSIAASPNLAVYPDSACNVPLTALNWGSAAPGGKVTQTIYVENAQGSSPLTLDMTPTNWTPSSANGPLTVTWNQEGTVLAPGQSIEATITLTVSPSITGIGSFGVQILISGTG